MIRDPIQGPPVTTSPPRPIWESIAIAYGILAFQFDVHPTILSVQVDMENKSKLGKPIMAGFLGKFTKINKSNSSRDKIHFNYFSYCWIIHCDGCDSVPKIWQ